MDLIFPKYLHADYYLVAHSHEDARMRTLLALTLGLVAAPLPAEPPADVRLDQVSYADLLGELKARKGQVVLVDVWGTFCAPCKEKFPALVAMHQKYNRRGLAVVSVSVDPPDDADAHEAARAFLTRQRAAFRNVILTDKAEVWQAKWQIEGPPLVFLFDKQGRLVAKWEGKFNPDEVEKRVAALTEE
ncbi:MAG TPA: TlpA disulfide reductase family protein [Gemmataceae bacterium]|nr:TlpA disulfide reductase family protein [Gemmataceae bacterium]